MINDFFSPKTFRPSGKFVGGSFHSSASIIGVGVDVDVGVGGNFPPDSVESCRRRSSAFRAAFDRLTRKFFMRCVDVDGNQKMSPKLLPKMLSRVGKSPNLGLFEKTS